MAGWFWRRGQAVAVIDGERAVKHLQIVMAGRESLLGCEAVVLPKAGILEILQQVAFDSCVGLKQLIAVWV